MYIQYRRLRLYPAAVVIMSILGSFISPLPAYVEGIEQEFLVTAYYSPLPDQCCYYRGNYADEITFNGNGTHGADGTPVYPGMIAAPETYAFGTRIDLPGVGIGTVHDRGGRIIEWENDLHRIDLWMGYGEEGLARALAWGARRVKGTVYPSGFTQPEERFTLADFPAPIADLRSMPKTQPTKLIAPVVPEDRSSSVRTLQQELKDAGFMQRSPTGYFGPETKAALKAFQETYGIAGDGAMLTDETQAALIALKSISVSHIDALPRLQKGMTGQDVRTIQKMMRSFGLYRGRTHGIFDDKLYRAVLTFQLQSGVIGTADTSGAGTFGPRTKAAALMWYKKELVVLRMKPILMRMEIARRIEEKLSITRTIVKGDKGSDVSAVQRLLKRLGLLSENDVTGYFGDKTLSAIKQYQLSREVVPSMAAHGAGNIGPATRAALRNDAISSSFDLVRAQGWDAL